MTSEVKSQPATVIDSAGRMETRDQLAEFLGDSRDWPHEILFIGGNEVPIYSCPQCGAACFNPFQHKAWHLQNCI